MIACRVTCSPSVIYVIESGPPVESLAMMRRRVSSPSAANTGTPLRMVAATLRDMFHALAEPEVLLEADGDKTRITASEAPFALTEEGVARALGQHQGWTDFCCCLKAYLQHGINLRWRSK